MVQLGAEREATMGGVRAQEGAIRVPDGGEVPPMGRQRQDPLLLRSGAVRP